MCLVGEKMNQFDNYRLVLTLNYRGFRLETLGEKASLNSGATWAHLMCTLQPRQYTSQNA